MTTIALLKPIDAADDPTGVAHPDAYHTVVRADIDLLTQVVNIRVYTYHDDDAYDDGLSPVRDRVYTCSGTDFTDIFSPAAFGGGVDAYTHMYDWLQTQTDFVGATEVTA